MRRNAHPLVANTARMMAETLYESYASDDRFYAATHKREGRPKFVARMTIMLLEDARQALVRLLEQPNIPDAQKDEIAEALILDDELRHGRQKHWLH